MNTIRVAQNFIDTYGTNALQDLLNDFQMGVSGQVIASRLGVSRERVRQWRNTFGKQIISYQTHADVLSLGLE